MIYNQGFPVGYQPAVVQPQMPQQYQPPTITQPTPVTSSDGGIIWVQGEAGAKSYPVGAGKSVLLMDSESDSFYIKSTDISGVPMPLRIFQYSEIVQTQNMSQDTQPQIDTSRFVTREELDTFKQDLNKLRQEIKQDKPKTMTRKEKDNAE